MSGSQREKEKLYGHWFPWPKAFQKGQGFLSDFLKVGPGIFKLKQGTRELDGLLVHSLGSCLGGSEGVVVSEPQLKNMWGETDGNYKGDVILEKHNIWAKGPRNFEVKAYWEKSKREEWK